MRHAVFAVAALLAVEMAIAGGRAQRALTFEDRVRAQEAIERVYYAHQIGTTARFEEAVPRAVLEEKVRKYLAETGITDEMLQREVDRIAAGTRMPERLRELYAALGNDPVLIKECLARATLADRLASGRLPESSRMACAADGTWDPGSSSNNSPNTRYSHTAVWTGSLMIVWGGIGNLGYLNDGSRYDPTTDSWTGMSATNAPFRRASHTAVWTGSVMVVWGGYGGSDLNTGGRYDPASDTWKPTSVVNAPSARDSHSAVWTGARMVVWGGYGGGNVNTGGRYDPATDTWTQVSVTNAPSARNSHSAVWTGTRMVVWGGTNGAPLNTGGRYDPATDSWTPTSGVNAPSGRYFHSAVWTGSAMIVWGGSDAGYLDTGGRYNPVSDSWTPTSQTNAPSARTNHTAVWTGSLMLIWGGYFNDGSHHYLDTGAQYDPGIDGWTATSPTGAPSPRQYHSAVWTGSAMIVWGGLFFTNGTTFYLNTGGRYLLGTAVDNDGDGLTECQGDCNDANAAVFPGAPSLCDGVKNDCTAIGPAMPAAESDGDADGVRLCQGDCDNTRGTVYPGAPQICDGLNNDCADPSWPAVPANEANADGDSFTVCQGDCSDHDATTYPGAPQLCDGKNNNCSDSSWPTIPASELDADLDGFRTCNGDCNDASAAIHPGVAEVCDSVDNNCNGQLDEDAAGEDSDGDGMHNACDNCRFTSNPTQTDGDGDRVGNACDNCVNTSNANQLDGDSDGRGDACDNCPAVPNGFQDDLDGDRVGDVCDNCSLDYNTSQSDVDHDGQGDMCDLNDGLIYVYSTDKSYREWQAESGFATWNSYRGSLSILRAAGPYTQAPGSNPLAARDCGLTDPYVFDLLDPAPGEVAFNLVTGVAGGVESGLGTNSAGTPRVNANPCP